MKGKWKARVMAAVMAFCMGISPVVSSVAYAAEEPTAEAEITAGPQDGTAEITIETAEQREQKQRVTAEDLTKDVSDETFDAETSLEGITYDPEQESVVLSSIEDGDGNSYQKGLSGVF